MLLFKYSNALMSAARRQDKVSELDVQLYHLELNLRV
jgi:hypothetical protein